MSQRIQDITTKNNGRSVRNIKTDKKTGQHDGDAGQQMPPRSRQPSSGGVWFIVAIFILFLFFGFSVLFSQTTVTVFPKLASIDTEGTYTATAKSQSDDLEYEIMMITKEREKEVPSSGETFVEQRAEGEITVYNAYSESPVNLVENTRFESESGNIYRAPEPISIPGRSTNDAGEVVPGKTTITIRAAEPGEEYNVESGRFTIPGLEGDPSFEETYAEVATPISGGFAGMQKTVSEETRQQARDELRNEMKTELLNEAHSQKPDGFILYDEGIFISYDAIQNTDSGSGENVVIREKATLRGIIFENSALATHLAKRHVSSYEDGSVKLQSPGDLSFSIENSDEFAPEDESDLQFSLSGAAQLVWQFNDNQLKEDLIGQDKDDLDRILSSYEGIRRAEVVMRPFWKRAFPETPAEITIETVIQSGSGE